MSEEQDRITMGDPPMDGGAIYAQTSEEGDPPPHEDGTPGDPPPSAGEGDPPPPEDNAPISGGGTGEGDPPPH